MGELGHLPTSTLRAAADSLRHEARGGDDGWHCEHSVVALEFTATPLSRTPDVAPIL